MKLSVQEQVRLNQPHTALIDHHPLKHLPYYLQLIPHCLMGPLLYLVGSLPPQGHLPYFLPGWTLERHRKNWSALSRKKVAMTSQRKDLPNSSMNLIIICVLHLSSAKSHPPSPTLYFFHWTIVAIHGPALTEQQDIFALCGNLSIGPRETGQKRIHSVHVAGSIVLMKETRNY